MSPARSEITPPIAANMYGTAMRRVWMMKMSAIMSLHLRRSASANEGADLGHRRRHGDDHHGLEHVDEFFRHDRVDSEAALRDRREEQRGDDDAQRRRAA